MSKVQELRKDLMSCIDALQTIDSIISKESDYEKASKEIRQILDLAINDIVSTISK